MVDDSFPAGYQTSKGLIVLPGTMCGPGSPLSKLSWWAYSVCCQCTMCTDLCPRHLFGTSPMAPPVMRDLAAGGPVDAGRSRQERCFAASAEYAISMLCFMGLSPRRVNQMLKVRLGPIK